MSKQEAYNSIASWIGPYGGRGQGRFSSQGLGRGGGGRYQNNRRGQGRCRWSYKGDLDRSYSAEGWAQLSVEERPRIYRGRERQRSISAVTADPRDDMFVVTEIRQPLPPTKNNNANA